VVVLAFACGQWLLNGVSEAQARRAQGEKLMRCGCCGGGGEDSLSSKAARRLSTDARKALGQNRPPGESAPQSSAVTTVTALNHDVSHTNSLVW
jgi:hypothetical protein